MELLCPQDFPTSRLPRDAILKENEVHSKVRAMFLCVFARLAACDYQFKILEVFQLSVLCGYTIIYSLYSLIQI